MEVDSAFDSDEESESPLQAIEVIRTRPRAIPIIVLRINLDLEFNLVSLSDDIV